MINFDLTTKVEIFVAHSGPKLSYSNKPLGDEFFIKSHSLLFELEIQAQKIKTDFWDELPIFFFTNAKYNCPFDIFAASFFLLSRYEECMPYLKTNSGNFDSSQSISTKFDFLELPLLSYLSSQKTLVSNFHQIVKRKDHKASRKILLEVPLAFRYSNRSFLENLEDFISSIWKLNLKQLIFQILVLIRLKNDPFDTFDFWKEWFNRIQLNPRYSFFFLKAHLIKLRLQFLILDLEKLLKTEKVFSLAPINLN